MSPEGCVILYFLIGIIVFIVFVLFFYFYIRIRIRTILNQAGFSGMNLKDVIEEARLEDQEMPKSLASMDRIYLKQILKDFPSIHIDELRRKAETIIMNCFQAVSLKDTSSLKGKMKSFSENMINEYSGKDVKFNQFKIHNTVISKYYKNKGVATICFSSSFEYFLDVDGKSSKTQDRARVEFIYVIDETKVSHEVSVLGIHCPNCGSPITNLGEKQCSYCGSAVLEIISKVFTCNNIERY